MRTTIDIPDAKYKVVKMVAAQRNTTVKQMVLDGLSLLLKEEPAPPAERLKLPLIHSTRTDKLDLDNEKIYEIIDFP